MISSQILQIPLTWFYWSDQWLLSHQVDCWKLHIVKDMFLDTFTDSKRYIFDKSGKNRNFNV